MKQSYSGTCYRYYVYYGTLSQVPDTKEQRYLLLKCSLCYKDEPWALMISQTQR